jgi:hypothetical protein
MSLGNKKENLGSLEGYISHSNIQPFDKEDGVHRKNNV